jgi:acyl transferase domain-containing protein
LSVLDMCYTASTGRNHFKHRLALVTEDYEDLRVKLQTIASGIENTHLIGQDVFRGVIEEGSPESKHRLPYSNDADSTGSTAVSMRTLAQRYVVGAPVDWIRVYSGEATRRVPLPTYPFERERFWIGESDAHPLLGRRM